MERRRVSKRSKYGIESEAYRSRSVSEGYQKGIEAKRKRVISKRKRVISKRERERIEAGIEDGNRASIVSDQERVIKAEAYQSGSVL